LLHVIYFFRFTVKELLQHNFFLEDTGIKVELASTKDEAKDVTRDVIQLWLRVVDPKKRKQQHKDDEAIQFDYNIKKDNADKVAQEMVIVIRLLEKH
jgi:WNK lysine deficient protein kinase